MATRNDKVNAGLFLVLSFLLVASLLILVTGWQIKGERVVYYCIFSSSIGSLQDGAGVRYMGVPVGKVTDIQFAEGDPSRIRVTMELDKERSPIQTNTYATLRVQILETRHLLLAHHAPRGPEVDHGDLVLAPVDVAVAVLGIGVADHVRGLVAGGEGHRQGEDRHGQQEGDQ